MSSPTLEQIIEEGRTFRRDFVSRRIKRGIEANALSGLSSGPVPLGYRIEIVAGQRRAVVDQTIAPLVREAFHLAATVKYSIQNLVAIMTEKGLCSRHGKPLHAMGLWRILSNPFYRGIVRYRGPSYRGTHPELASVKCYSP